MFHHIPSSFMYGISFINIVAYVQIAGKRRNKNSKKSKRRWITAVRFIIYDKIFLKTILDHMHSKT